MIDIKQSIVRVCAVLAGAVLLASCGGGQPAEKSQTATAVVPERVIAAADVPALSLCITQIVAKLQTDEAALSSATECMAGSYRGLTATGRACELSINVETGAFEFRVEDAQVNIERGVLAYSAQGKPFANLEDASLPKQPGLQLVRFTPATGITTQALTEVLILRMGRGNPVLPTMVYQRSDGADTKFQTCLFGK